MKTKHLICLAVLCGFSSSLHAQTPPLTPSGPPSDPTTAMKSLNQVEPRTPIGTLPFTITQPGSYYFAGNLHFTAATGDAITVNASNVTIDLMGFTLSSTSAVTGTAIRFGPTADMVAVQNGHIKGNTTVTKVDVDTWGVTAAGFEYGIGRWEGGLQMGRFTNLSIIGCRKDGLIAPTSSLVENIVAYQNGEDGISANNSTIRGCSASTNGNDGIVAYYGTVSNCYADINQRYGIWASEGSVSQVAVNENGSVGIQADYSSVTNCRSYSNRGHGIAGNSSSVTGSTSGTNGGIGIYAPNGVVAFCVSRSNTGANISATGATLTGNN